MEAVLANEIAISFISLGVFIFAMIICVHHFKKYNFLQGIISLITIPVLVHGLGVLLGYCFKSNVEMQEFFLKCVGGLDSIKGIYVGIFEHLGLDKFASSGWLYLPFGIIFILSYGYSITWRKKHKKNKEKKIEE